MKGTNDRRSQTAEEAMPDSGEAAPSDAKGDAPAKPASTKAKNGSPAAAADRPDQPPQHGVPTTSSPPAAAQIVRSQAGIASPAKMAAAGGIRCCPGGRRIFLFPSLLTALNTVSTDDAYINGHVTFVAPRVAGQVSKVLVDDNYYVKKGQVLVELDPEPYRVQVAIKKAAVEAAETDLASAQAEVRGQVAQARANRYKLQHAIEDVDTQIANLRASVATLNSRKATLELARANLKRAEETVASGATTQEELDMRKEASRVAEAAVEQALQAVYAIRVSLGLPAKPPQGHDLSEVPPELDQNFSTVRQALGELIHSAAQFGYFPTSWTATPKEAIAAFYKQDPEGDVNRIYAHLIPHAPAIKQAEAKLLQAQPRPGSRPS